MRRITLLTAIFGLLAVPASAGAATRLIFIIKGAGFGHGIGMSQYGAEGFAKHGWDYRQILGHYYTGTSLGQAQTRTVRVLLQDGRRSISFAGATGVGGKKADPNTKYTAKASGSRVTVNGHLGTFAAPLSITSSGGAVRLFGRADNGVISGAYRGGLEIRPSASGGLMAVNAASLDSYVKGVVPGEVPASWPAEALKAQAVAARTYALATDAGASLFDQYSDTRSQMYTGLNGEAASTNAAVDATAGQVVRYGGQLAVTYFFSTSGGKTEDVQNVFYGSTPEPYLVAVNDPYDNLGPRHRWQFTFSRSQMESKLRGLFKGHFKAIKVLKRGVSPRVVSAQVVGTKGSSTASGVTLRARLGLYDTWFNFSSKKVTKATLSHPRAASLSASRVARDLAAAAPVR
jgi:stage II sporulation protein D